LELKVPGDASHFDTLQTIELKAFDSSGKIHMEASQDGRVIASGDGSNLTVRRDVDGIVIEARSHPPTSAAQVLAQTLASGGKPPVLSRARTRGRSLAAELLPKKCQTR
jgi:hypothetical protein